MAEITLESYKGSIIEKGFINEPIINQESVKTPEELYASVESQLEENFSKGLIDEELFMKAKEELETLKPIKDKESTQEMEKSEDEDSDDLDEGDDEDEDDSVKKGADDDLEKGGEGSRGGHVIGHTQSGKPIYANKYAEEHGDFSQDEHKEASKIHKNLAGNYPKGSIGYINHMKASIRHSGVHEGKGFDEINDDDARATLKYGGTHSEKILAKKRLGEYKPSSEHDMTDDKNHMSTSEGKHIDVKKTGKEHSDFSISEHLEASDKHKELAEQHKELAKNEKDKDKKYLYLKNAKIHSQRSKEHEKEADRKNGY